MGTAPHRGTLRVYLGAAPGVGKTFAALSEAHRRAGRGTDVVVALVETHSRARVADLLAGLEVLPRRHLVHRGAEFTEMDLPRVLARKPDVAVVDELAHTNVPGTEHPKRWMDVRDLLEAGIDVITTVNIQHLESLNDVVESITGVRQRETVPDDVVRQADQIELVDMSPHALRRRLAHGNVYAPEKIDAALTSYFRVGNLTALRELALLWTADRVDAALERYRAEQGITQTWPARERVVVALAGGSEGETLLRRGARITERAVGGDLLALHVLRSDGLTGAAPDAVTRLRALTEQLGGTFHTVAGEDVATAILEFARSVNASQVVLGASRRGRVGTLFAPGVGADVVRESGDIDVHIVTHDSVRRRRVPGRTRTGLSPSRVLAGWIGAVVGLPVLTALLAITRDAHGLATVLMIYLLYTVVVALVGGLWPAVVTAVGSGLLANYLFTPPLYTLTIAQAENALSIVVLIAVAVCVSWVVDLGAGRSREAARARAEADTLTMLAGSVIRGQDAVPALLEQVRETFSFRAVALLERADGAWGQVAAAGDDPPADPRNAPIVLPVRDGLVVVADGARPAPQELRVLSAVALQADAMMERDQLRGVARAARAEHERAALRSALLAAVSHDLRTPLSAIKIAISSLRSPDLTLPPEDTAELLATIENGTDDLQSLIDNLLDMSRLDAGVVAPHRSSIALEDVVARALAKVDTSRLAVDVPEALPLVVADGGLAERVVANLVENALRHTPQTTPVLVQGAATDADVMLRVVDRGPGVPDEQKETMFQAFQRLGDVPNGQGVGLGLAVARGFAQALGGSLSAEDTPGGGLTMVFSLPIVRRETMAATSTTLP
jgi:two-component system sensor histidine kinase KdpD